jgi:hypothetical protein
MLMVGVLVAPNRAAGQDVSGLVTVTKSERSLTDLKTKMVTTTSTITVRNSSSQAIGNPINAVIEVSSAGVQVLDAVAPGTGNPYGKYYVDLSGVVASGSLNPGASVSFTIRFVCSNSIRYSYNIVTYGTLQIVKQTPTLTWNAPAAITYGTALSVTQLNATASVPGTFLYTPTLGAVLSAGPQTLNVLFTPNDTANYTTASTSVNITVNKATPNVTWGAPAAITYGTALSTTQLNATASVPGSFVYAPAAGAVLAVGVQTLNTVFTPTDSSNYTTASASQHITVTKAIPAITWGTPAAIGYGTHLSDTQLNATASVPGSFVYTPAAGTVLSVGTQTLRADFTPTDGTNYSTAFATVTIVVNKAIPAITWATPAAIGYGTALSGTQLNATVSVPGSFVYTPAAGTVLSAGTQTLRADFTPTDGTNYSTAVATVTIVVNKAIPATTWATPAAIGYGTALSGTQLNATASVPGSFVYTPAAGTVLSVGTQTLRADFTPTDGTNYSTAFATVTIVVNKAIPAITWATPAAIGYGTALSDMQLNATASVPGSFVYTPAAGTVLSVGTKSLRADFTPTDATNYSTAFATVTITVSSGIPAITWATPAAIGYGTALSDTQLNATASVPGSFVYTPAAGTVLSAGTKTLRADFTPTDLTNYSTTFATVNIVVNKVVPVITWGTPAAIGYGTALSDTQLNATASVPGSLVYTPAAGTVPSAGNQTLRVDFTPTDATNYSNAFATVSIVVNKAIPAITWGTPAAIGYGTALSNTQLNATASVPGSFVYTPAAGTVLSAGTKTLRADFTPTDGTNYSTAFATVSIVVNKAIPAINWATPAAIGYGTALSDTQLNATASVPGSFVYTPAAGTVLSAGTQNLRADFTPTDVTNYSTAFATVSIAVNKAIPAITWETPAAIGYGTALSDTQLKATASVPGSFVYTPAAGTVLSVGPQTLRADFTPTDVTNYSTAFATVAITVNKAIPAITWGMPVAISYGTALSETQLNATASVPGSFVYTPAAGAVLSVGPQTLRADFTPTDSTNFDTAFATVILTVNPVSGGNLPPVADAGADQTVALSGGQSSIKVQLDGTKSHDPDGSVATYLWTGTPLPNPSDGASPNVTLYAGTYHFTLVVIDNQGAASSPATVTVTVNQPLNPPVLTVNPLITSVDQGQTVTVNAAASQIDGNVVSISAKPFVENATFTATPGQQAAGIFSFTPSSTQSGVQTVTFTARNQLGLTDTKAVQITINKVNHAPSISMASTASVDVGKQISIKATASDPDGDILDLSASGVPANALFVPATGTITFAPDTSQVGTHAVTVTASDGKLSATAPVTITVNAVQGGGTPGSSQLVLKVDPVASLSLQPTQKITGSVNLPDQPVVQPIQSSLIVGMNPATGDQGSQQLIVTLTGQTSGSFPTHFVSGVSQANFGTGITVVKPLQVDSATSATATITIDPGASVGSRVVSVVTGNETAVSVVGFNVMTGKASITGRLMDFDTSWLLSGATVSVQGSTTTTTTIGNGTFVLNSVPAGAQNLTLNATDHEPVTIVALAQIGTTVNVGDVKAHTSVFNPAAAPTATLRSVFGRGGAEFSTGSMSKDELKKVVIDSILMTGGKSAGVLDDFGNQLNPNITGNGVVSLKASGVDLVADRMIRGETMTVGDFLYGFPLLFGWQTQPTVLRSLSALQDVVDQAWANPNDPMSALTIAVFNRGKSTLFDAPRLTPETPLNAIQAYLMSSTLFAWATNDIYYMDGSDTPPAAMLIGARERARTLLAQYQGEVVTDAAPAVLVADGSTAPIASATADRTNIVLDPGVHNTEVWVTLDGSHTVTFGGATIKLYQWRPAASSDPAPLDGNSPTATIKFTSGAHHTYTLTVTDTNNQRSAATVTINISGDCVFTTGSDQSNYPWCSTFQNFLAGQVLTKVDVVTSKVASVMQIIQPAQNGSPEIEKAATINLAAFATGLGIPQLTDPGSLKASYVQFAESAKSMNILGGFVKGAADLLKGQIDAVVGAVADKMFGYIIDKFTDQIIKDARPAPPFLRKAELVPAGNSAVSQQVKLTFMPSTDEKNDFTKATTPALDPETHLPVPGNNLNGIRKYSYLVFRQDLKSGEAQRIAVITGKQLTSKELATGTLPDYVWIDNSSPPVGTNTYFLVTRVIRTDSVPNTVDTTNQKLLMDYMLAIIPGGGVLNSAFTAVDIADKILRGLFLQDSDMSRPAHIYVGDVTQNLHPTLDLAVDKFRRTAFISIPETSGIFKILPSGLEEFVDAGFKTPYQGGLAIDTNGTLYSDNKASDDSYGGRIFSFQAETGARQLAGSANYFSQMLMYAKPANVATLAYGRDSQGECIYIADAMDQSIKRMALHTANPAEHNVGQYYAQSGDLHFVSTTKMASDLSGNLFLTEGPDLMQVTSAPGSLATVTPVFPDPDKNPFSWLTGVDVDLHGNLYLADQVLGTITMVPVPYSDFMTHDAAYRKRFVVMSGLVAPQDLKLTGDGRGFVTVDSVGLRMMNFGISGRIWDQAAGAPLDGATLLVDEALSPGKTDADGFFALPDINFPFGPQQVKLKVVAKDGRTQLIPNIQLNGAGHTALVNDLLFNPPSMPKLPPIPPADSSVTVDPDPLPLEAPPIQVANANLGQTRTQHFTIPDRRIFPTNSPNPPPLPPPSTVSDSLPFAPAPVDPPTDPAPSAPSVVQPTVAIVTPADGMITRAGSLTVVGMVESTQSLASVTLTLNGVDQQVPVVNGTFSATVNLSDGLNVISARGGTVWNDTANNILYREGNSLPVKVQMGASLTPSLDFSGVVMRSDGTGYQPYVDMIVTLYGMVEAGAGYRIIDSVSVRGDGVYQFHLENGATASATLQSLFQQLGNGTAVPMKIVVSDPRS